MDEKNPIDVRLAIEPVKKPIDPQRKLGNVEIDAAPIEEFGGRVADREPVSPDPGQRLRVLTAASNRNLRRGPERLIDRRRDGKKLLSNSGSVSSPQCLRMLSIASRRGDPREDTETERRHDKSGSTRFAVAEKIVRERKIDPIDAVRRAGENASEQSRDVVDDRPLHLGCWDRLRIRDGGRTAPSSRASNSTTSSRSRGRDGVQPGDRKRRNCDRRSSGRENSRGHSVTLNAAAASPRGASMPRRVSSASVNSTAMSRQARLPTTASIGSRPLSAIAKCARVLRSRRSATARRALSGGSRLISCEGRRLPRQSLRPAPARSAADRRLETSAP